MHLNKILLSVISSCVVFTAFGQGQDIPVLPLAKHELIVIAHRGSHLVKPENTIAAIEEAIQLGADYVEIDLRTTLDGQLVLSHNETVDKMTNGKGKIREMRLEELKKLSVNSKDGGVYRIASFSEALKTCKGKINIYLDFKDAAAEQAYHEIQAAGMEKQILVYLNQTEHYAAWKKAAPQLPLMGRLPAGVRTKAELLAALQQQSLQAIDKLDDTTPLAALKENKVSVFLDVQSKEEGPASWKAAIDKGVQGLQTDHPAALIAYLKANHLRRETAAALN